MPSQLKKCLTVFVLAACTTALCFGENAEERAKEIEFLIHFKKSRYKKGEILQAPSVTFRNVSAQDFGLPENGGSLQPALSLVRCRITSPTNDQSTATVSMPTGRPPEDFPKRELKIGETLTTETPGIWYWIDNVGYDLYALTQEGNYQVACTYDETLSSAATIYVR